MEVPSIESRINIAKTEIKNLIVSIKKIFCSNLKCPFDLHQHLNVMNSNLGFLIRTILVLRQNRIVPIDDNSQSQGYHSGFSGDSSINQSYNKLSSLLRRIDKIKRSKLRRQLFQNVSRGSSVQSSRNQTKSSSVQLPERIRSLYFQPNDKTTLLYIKNQSLPANFQGENFHHSQHLPRESNMKRNDGVLALNESDAETSLNSSEYRRRLDALRDSFRPDCEQNPPNHGGTDRNDDSVIEELLNVDQN